MDPVLSDPEWFPLRHDLRSEAIVFAQIPAEMHRALTFISDFRPAQMRAIPRQAIGDVPIAAPLHIILHSGLGGSTLLARALAQPGVVTTLKEPPILTDVVAFGLQAGETETRRLLGQVASLISRPFATGEALVCKMSSVGNGLSASIAEARPETQILCLQTPLEQFLVSLAGKGTEGRAGGRRLFVGLQNSRMTCVTVPETALATYGDLQLAALAWLSIQKMIVDACEKLGSARVRSLGSGTLLNDPRRSLTAIARRFRLRLDVEARLASGIFSRHAKTGEPFDTQKRAAILGKTLEDHGAEIIPIVEWARKIADAEGIGCDLPYPLLD